ncbi:MAG: transposase [Candidatus Hydrogenedentes bacterium]|nr:transposase [Candidatus Hydrogenedentota bacterium]
MDDEASHSDTKESPVYSGFLEPSVEIDVTKRHMPHWQLDGGLYFVTWRLADSLPQALLRQWSEEKRVWLQRHPKPWDAHVLEVYRREFPRRMEEWLDAGHGECVLRVPACAEILAAIMQRFDGERYDIASFVIMPNHVHALFQLRGGTKLEPLLQAWKGGSARRINERLGKRGTLWQQESRDTSIRDAEHLVRSYVYTLENPKKARLQKGEYLHYESPGLREQLRALRGDFDAGR